MNRFLKLIGFLGLLLAFLAASSLVGLSYAHYHHPVQMLMVVGMTTAAMLCIFGAHCLGFMAKGVVSVFQEVAPNPRYAMMALAGRRYSLAAGVIAMIQGLVVALASIASDSAADLAYKFASSFVGLTYGVFISAFICGHLHHAFSDEDE